MSQQARPVLCISVLASAAIAFGQAVALTAPATPSSLSGTPATAAGQKIFGVANRDAAAGATCDVTVLGTAICIAGAAIAVGARVQCDASGRVITATALTTSVGTLAVAAGATAVTSAAANGAGTISGAPTVAGGDPPIYVYGTALQAASALGDLIEVLICP